MQLEYFSRSHRTIAVDLCGHGLSDVPQRANTFDGLADDLAWVGAQLELVHPLVDGHSLGGIVALASPRTIPTSWARLSPLISVLLAGDARKAARTTMLERLRSDDYLRVVREYLAGFFDASDDPERRRWILKEIGGVPSQVAVSIWEDGTFEFNNVAAVSACRARPDYRYAGTRRRIRAPTNPLTHNASR